MGSSGAAVRRARWVVVFTLLLLASSSIPVIAAESSPPAETSDATSLLAPSREELERLPDAQEVQEGIEMAEAEEAARERALQTPEAVTQRRESRYAFADLNAAEAQELFLAVFAKQLETLNGDPARWLSDASIAQPLGESAATVSKDGDTMLLDATIPLRAADEDGDLRKVDLSLEAKPGGALEPANPLVDLRIPGQVDEPLLIGEEGIALTPVGAAGDRGAQLLGDKNVFYADALGPAADTDQIVSPTATGVEIFDLLRSADSPEEVRFEVDLPEGAELRSDGNGGAQILRGEESLASIPFPHATDAQGTVIPVDLSIEGSTVALHVAHREADVAYPLILDPAILNDWYNYSWANGHNFQVLENGTWNAQGNTGWIQTGTSCLVTCFWSSGRGLYIGMQSGNHSPSNYSQWLFSAPNPNSYLAGAWINPFRREDYNCGSYNQPHDYVGMWHNGAWNIAPKINQAKIYGYTDPNSWGSTLIIGMHTGGGVNIPCRRDLAVGGTAIWEDDWQSPTIDSVTGIPSGWFSDATQITVTANARDDGLGVRKVTLTPQDKAVIDHVLGCTGLVNSRCPTTYAYKKSFTADSLEEGVRSLKASAEDPLNKGSGSFETYTRVDRSPPKVTLSGQLAQATNEAGSEEVAAGKGDELSLPVYNLKVEATDGSTQSDATKRSGVKDIEIFLDGDELEVPWAPQSCPSSSCPMTKTYALKLSNLTVSGKHTLKVRAIDQVGKVRERNIEFEYFPATGMKDEYVMHYFPLPDGLGAEDEEEHPARPELAVNVMNGNLVYRERDLDVEGPAVDLEVERFYNSQLPDSEDTEWGDGWTLAQTPDLKPLDTGGSPAPDEAELIEASGAIEEGVELPIEAGAEKFDPTLQATLGMKASGGYELTDETGESATSVAFDEDGRTEALLTEGYAKVDYSYEEGELAEIAVDDPASAGGGPAEEAAEPEEEPSGPYTGVIYADAFGSNGSQDGQLKSPGGVTIDSAGNIWLADTGNDRIQKFSSSGEFLAKFGSTGSGNGQLEEPLGIFADSKGFIWVADTGNNRVQKFSTSGEFVKSIGSTGTATGQFDEPVGVAVGPGGGVLFVADRGNDRVQVFLTSNGAFITKIGTHGSAPEQFIEPSAVTMGLPYGEASYTILVADSGNHRVQRWSVGGQYLGQIGAQGSAPGKLDRPEAIDVDASGNVWVGDRANSRIQQFSEAGEYFTQFGSQGSGEGEFALAAPMGIAADNASGIWVTDAGNHRIQKWVAGRYIPDEEEAEPAPDDPRVEVEVSGDLVSSVAGEEAGEHAYQHAGELLTAHDGPQGETKYEYDAAGRMTKVMLPNGTYGSIAYHTDGRVKSVTVDPAGSEAAKTTYFDYSDEPRRTTVTPPGAPHVYYDIGADGSVFKWWNAEEPPTFELAGTFWDFREETEPIWWGAHWLEVQANDAEGIASIQVIANGSDLVHETSCDQDLEPPEVECEDLISEWVTEAELHAPGHLNLEVLVTDWTGESSSERFWVDIPKGPPPIAPGIAPPPKFRDIARFREEYGLEIVFPVENERELNKRIFNLIGAWHNPHTPEGEVARASWERWGVPLRWEDVAEMEYREWLYRTNAERIDQWVESASPSSYAGYYIDHAAGGIMRVGFTGSQNEQLESLKASLPLVAGDRLQVYPTIPTVSYLSVREASQSVSNAIESNATLGELVVNVKEDEAGKAVRIGTPDIAQVESILDQMLGPNAPIIVEYDAGGGSPLSGRFRNSGRMRAGDYIISRHYKNDVHAANEDCTAGFGAKDKAGEVRGGTVWRLFVLTAGHCTQTSVHAKTVYRSTDSDPYNEGPWREVGRVARDAFADLTKKVRTDAEAIRVESAGLVPQAIYGWGGSPIPTGHAGKIRKGYTVCFSGATTQIPSCGQVVARSTHWKATDGIVRGGYWVKFSTPAIHGDSGAPVWAPAPGSPSIGLVTAGRPPGSFTETLVEPLLHPPNMASNMVPGILHHPLLRPLSLKLGG